MINTNTPSPKQGLSGTSMNVWLFTFAEYKLRASFWKDDSTLSYKFGVILKLEKKTRGNLPLFYKKASIFRFNYHSIIKTDRSIWSWNWLKEVDMWGKEEEFKFMFHVLGTFQNIKRMQGSVDNNSSHIYWAFTIRITQSFVCQNENKARQILRCSFHKYRKRVNAREITIKYWKSPVAKWTAQLCNSLHSDFTAWAA